VRANKSDDASTSPQVAQRNQDPTASGRKEPRGENPRKLRSSKSAGFRRKEVPSDGDREVAMTVKSYRSRMLPMAAARETPDPRVSARPPQHFRHPSLPTGGRQLQFKIREFLGSRLVYPAVGPSTSSRCRYRSRCIPRARLYMGSSRLPSWT
jgi:hypothetical protein